MKNLYDINLEKNNEYKLELNNYFETHKDKLKLFKEIMSKTADRREFIDRPLSYYQNMFKILKEKDNVYLDTGGDSDA